MKQRASKTQVEQEVAKRFLVVYNKQLNSNYEISISQPPQNDPVDVLVEDPSNNTLKLQIRVSDDEPWSDLVKGKMVERSGKRYEVSHKAIKRAIELKATKYDTTTKNEIILVLDGWLGVSQEDLDEFKSRENRFLISAGFKEIWFIGSTISDKLSP